MDSEPPLKRRRTSQTGSDNSSRGRSRSQSRSRPQTRRQSTTSQTRNRSKSADYNTPNSQRNNSYTPTSSRTQSPTTKNDEQEQEQKETYPSKPRLTFTPLFNLPKAHARGITSAKFSPDSTLLATASADASIKIWAVPPSPTPSTPFKLLRTLHSHRAGINALSWSPIGPPYTLASASDDKMILLWSPLLSSFPIPPSPLTGHSNYVYSLSFSPKGNMLVTGSHDEAVFLWDVRSARVMRQLPAHSDPVSGVDFVRDGTMVVSCASDGLIRIWDSGTGQCLKTLVHEDRKGVSAVRFSPNGRYVVAWTLDSCVRLWRYLGAGDGGGCVKTFQGHVNTRYSLCGTIGEYTPQIQGSEGAVVGPEAFVASGSEDGDVLVWDINTKDVLWRGTGHSDVVLAVDWARAADGRGMLVSVGKDRMLKVWIEDIEPRSVVKTDQSHTVQLEVKREDTDMNG